MKLQYNNTTKKKANIPNFFYRVSEVKCNSHNQTINYLKKKLNCLFLIKTDFINEICDL